MSDSKWKKDEDKEEEEEEDDTNYMHQKDAVIFAIHISRTMLAPPPESTDRKAEKQSPAIAALECAYQIMQQRIISSPKDMMGVLLFGTEKNKFQGPENSRGALFPNCYLLNDLHIPAAEDVKLLREVIAGEEEYEDLLVPATDPVSIPNLLFCANQIFTTEAPSFGSRRLFIITDNDNPHEHDKAAAKNAQTRSKDLNDLGVIIELFPISHPNNEFVRSKFYDDIIYRDPTEDEEATISRTKFKSSNTDGISLLSSLISDINSKHTAKRTLFSGLPFEIGPGLHISVKGYNMVQPAKAERTDYVYMGGEERQLVTGKSDRVGDDNKEPVQKSDIQKAFKFGGSQVIFKDQELKDLKNFGTPVLRVIGFKPQSMLPFWASIKKSTFIFPSEEHYVGSTRVFASFWKKLLKDKIMALAWYIARRNATPIIVAIMPSQERLDERTKMQTSPAGLWLCPIPFADDVREIGPLPKPILASEALVGDMITIVQQLQLPKAVYNPASYPNPKLQWHFVVLQCIALEDEVPEVPDDKTLPKFKQINKRAGHYINKWGLTLDEEPQHLKKESLFKKETLGKHNSEDPEEPKKKRIKTESSSVSLVSMTNTELKDLVDNGTLAKYTAVQLKELCKEKGLPLTGNKSVVVDRIEEWLEKD